MMREYMSKTAEIDFLRKHMATMEKEVLFWEERRSLAVEKDGQSVCQSYTTTFSR